MEQEQEQALKQDVRAAFAPDGPLAQADPHFLARSGQTAMALEVASTVVHGGALVIEAGTGVGKTFAYLVPALLSGERVLISTATKTLQDQLFSRDLPALVAALKMPVRMALLKGRASYLCLHRMQIARHDTGAENRGAMHALARIEEWSHATHSGDLAELAGLDERSPVIPLVTSTRENCLGSQCPSFRPCHVNLARREALAADVVVINHHLFFADLAVRESGMAELLPTVRLVIFDEAHKINEIGVQFLGSQLTTGQLLDLVRDMLAAGIQLARGLTDWQGLAAQLDHAARHLRLMAGQGSNKNVGSYAGLGSTLKWVGPAPEAVDADAWAAALHAVHTACCACVAVLNTFSEIAPDFVRLHERASRMAAQSARFAAACGPDAVRWVDAGAHQVRLVESPLDIADAMQTRLLRLPPASHASADTAGKAQTGSTEKLRERAWVFTSASLGDDAELTWFTEPCGLLGHARIVRVESPFDYASQAAIYVPRDLPKPSSPEHSAQLARLVGNAAIRLGGRTLVLTTSLKALRTIGDALRSRFEAGLTVGGPIEVLVQGEWPKRRLMERFREGDRTGLGCVLVASASFWEGVDLPGDALQLLVIDKLPFPAPNDPLVEARSQRLDLMGQSAFRDYSLPEAAVALKQGAGRLIRRESDHGILLVADTRLVTMGYGKRLLAALPPMRILQSESEFDQALEALAVSAATKLSTTDPYWP